MLSECSGTAFLSVYDLSFFVREFNFYEIIQSHDLTLQLLLDTFVTVVYLTTNILFCKHLYKIKKDCEVYPSRIAAGFSCLLILFILDWGLIAPPMGAAAHPARIVSCNSHMKQIHQACLEYADRYENCFPPDLKTLMKFMPELEEDQIHYCPEVFKHEGYSDYIYHGAGLKKNNLPDNFLLIEDKKNNHPKRYGPNRLYLDSNEYFGHRVERKQPLLLHSWTFTWKPSVITPIWIAE